MPTGTALGAAFTSTSSLFHRLSPPCCICPKCSFFVPKLSQEQGKCKSPAVQSPPGSTAKLQLISHKLQVSLLSKSFSPCPPLSGRVSLWVGEQPTCQNHRPPWEPGKLLHDERELKVSRECGAGADNSVLG